ncbi:MAG: hypothetical protein RMN51_13545, partial [Verrucomicrobiota bacterium]|nr:hypothetical protein [Verrucomicrobiota bacterium]
LPVETAPSRRRFGATPKVRLALSVLSRRARFPDRTEIAPTRRRVRRTGKAKAFAFARHRRF